MTTKRCWVTDRMQLFSPVERRPVACDEVGADGCVVGLCPEHHQRICVEGIPTERAMEMEEST